MRVNEWTVLSRAIEEGVSYGWQRAHKHTETPDPQLIKETIEQAIENSICEVFTFDEFLDEDG
jgi:hypothetical protein